MVPAGWFRVVPLTCTEMAAGLPQPHPERPALGLLGAGGQDALEEDLAGLVALADLDPARAGPHEADERGAGHLIGGGRRRPRDQGRRHGRCRGRGRGSGRHRSGRVGGALVGGALVGDDHGGDDAHGGNEHGQGGRRRPQAAMAGWPVVGSGMARGAPGPPVVAPMGAPTAATADGFHPPGSSQRRQLGSGLLGRRRVERPGPGGGRSRLPPRAMVRGRRLGYRRHLVGDQVGGVDRDDGRIGLGGRLRGRKDAKAFDVARARGRTGGAPGEPRRAGAPGARRRRHRGPRRLLLQLLLLHLPDLVRLIGDGLVGPQHPDRFGPVGGGGRGNGRTGEVALVGPVGAGGSWRRGARWPRPGVGRPRRGDGPPG